MVLEKLRATMLAKPEDLETLRRSLDRLTTKHDEVSYSVPKIIHKEQNMSHIEQEDIWKSLGISVASKRLLTMLLDFRKNLKSNSRREQYSQQ